MLAIPVVCPIPTRTLRRFSFPLPSSTANRCRIHMHGDCWTYSTYSAWRYPLFDITILSKQLSDPRPRPFMNDLSPQMPIYLPKLTIVLSRPRPFAIRVHLMALSTSMSHGLRALGVCMPVPLVLSRVLHSVLSNILTLHKPNVYA